MAFFSGVHTDARTVGTASVLVHDSSPGGGTPVLLLSGAQRAESVFWALYPMLATRHRVVAIESADDAVVLSPEQVADAIPAISATGAADVVGFGAGAAVAIELAARHPGSVRTLTLIGGRVRSDAHERLRVATWRAAQDASPTLLARLATLAHYSSPYINALPEPDFPALVGRIRDRLESDPGAFEPQERDLAEVAATIAAPTLVVGASSDVINPIRHSELLFGAIANARLARVRGGHDLLTERSAEIYDLIDGFVRRPDQHPAGHVLAAKHA